MAPQQAVPAVPPCPVCGPATEGDPSGSLAPAPVWRPAPPQPTLAGDEIHVWRAGLDVDAYRLRRLTDVLSSEERTRAGRFRLPRDSARYVAGRGLLRELLGRYLDAAPSRLCFSYGSHGKPALAGQMAEQGLRFNVSHSHGLALYAFARDRELGVDVERIRTGLADTPAAERFLAPEEATVLRALPPAQRETAFFTCWCRKEAYLKAKGLGLALPLDQFVVTVTPGEPAKLLAARWDAHEPPRWRLADLAPARQYAGAVAVEGYSWQLRCWDWPARAESMPGSRGRPTPSE